MNEFSHNHEGYPDPTANQALNRIMREEKEKELKKEREEKRQLINIFKRTCELMGYKVINVKIMKR